MHYVSSKGGRITLAMKRCLKCRGKGHYTVDVKDVPAMMLDAVIKNGKARITCPSCKGKGFTNTTF